MISNTGSAAESKATEKKQEENILFFKAFFPHQNKAINHKSDQLWVKTKVQLIFESQSPLGQFHIKQLLQNCVH